MTILQDLIQEDFGIEGRGKWFHSQEHDSLVFNADGDYFFWNSTGLRGNALDYLVKVRGLKKEDARNFLKNYFGAFKENGETFQDVLPYDKLVGTFWFNGLENRDYWYKRCLTDETIDRRSLGYHDGWFTIPLYENGDFVNFQLRRDEPKKAITQWYRRGKALPLYNEGILPYVKDTIYITEGTVDSILLNQIGLPSVSPNGTNTWQADWFSKFSGIKRVIYVADNDKAGYNGAKLVANSLGIYKVKIVLFEGMYEKYDTVNFFQDNGSKESYLEWIEAHSYYLFELENVYGKTRDLGKYKKEFAWSR
jgi:DNA primase